VKIPIQSGISGQPDAGQRRVKQVVWIGAGLIVGGVMVPSAALIFRRLWHLYYVWDWWLFASPSFYLFLYASGSAALQPAFALTRFLPVLEAQDATVRVARGLVAWQVVWAALAAGFWQFLAWGSFPMVSPREIRFIPFYPWPGS
jgi:hypothetical protein